MGSFGSKKTTKTTSNSSSTPLDAYAPYISKGLETAQNVLNDNQGNMANMSQSAYGLYNTIADQVKNPSSFVTGAQGVASNIYNGNGPGSKTYTNLMDAAANDPSMVSLKSLANAGPNPATSILQGMTSQTTNPLSSDFYKSTLDGDFLNANPYLDAITKQATDAATLAANQRFAASGMGEGLSTPYANVLGSSIADANNQTRYKAYADELARMGQIGSQSDSQYNATRDRELAAANGLSTSYLGNQAQLLDAAKALGGQYTNDNGTALTAANGATQAQLNALGLVPGLSSAQYAGVAPALSALQTAAQIPYTGVNNYANLVNGLTAKYGNQNSNSTTVEKTSQGLGSVAAGIAGQALAAYAGGGFGGGGGGLFGSLLGGGGGGLLSAAQQAALTPSGLSMGELFGGMSPLNTTPNFNITGL